MSRERSLRERSQRERSQRERSQRERSLRGRFLRGRFVRALLLLGLVGAGIAIYAVVLHQAYTWRATTHPDFYVDWMGTRAALRGENPYSSETMRATQMGSKGFYQGEGPLTFAYPYYRIFLNVPIAFLPYDWATAIWHAVTQTLLFIGVILFVQALNWRPRPLEVVMALLLAFLPYPILGSIVLGQTSVVVLAMLLIAFWALRRDHDWVAGCCLALATLKPHLSILAIPGLLLWSLAQRRWHVLLSFAVALGILSGLSFLAFPPWLGEFLRVMFLSTSHRTIEVGPSLLLNGCCGPVWPWLLEAAALLLMLWTWWPARHGGAWQTDGAFAVTMTMTCFLPPQTSPVDRLMLLPAMLLLLRDMPNWLARLVLVVASIATSWLAYFYLYQTHYELHMVLTPLLVLLALAAWYVLGRDKNGGQEPSRPQPA